MWKWRLRTVLHAFAVKMDESEPEIHENVVTFFAESVYLDSEVETNEQFEATGPPNYQGNDNTDSSHTLKQEVHEYQIKVKPKSEELNRDAGISFENIAECILNTSSTGYPEQHCRYCQKSFTSRHYYRKHVASAACIRDVRNPRIMCMQCGKKFRDASDLARHDNFHRIKEQLLSMPAARKQ